MRYNLNFTSYTHSLFWMRIAGHFTNNFDVVHQSVLCRPNYGQSTSSITPHAGWLRIGVAFVAPAAPEQKAGSTPKQGWPGSSPRQSRHTIVPLFNTTVGYSPDETWSSGHAAVVGHWLVPPAQYGQLYPAASHASRLHAVGSFGSGVEHGILIV